MFRPVQKLFLILIAVLMLAVACGSADTSSGGAASSDDTAAPATSSDAGPDFQAALVSGGEFDSTDLHGEPTVYWFWASW